MDINNKQPHGILQIFKQIFANLQHRAQAQPGKNLNIIAITGSKGKTTTAHIAYEIFMAAGIKSAVISTMGTFVAGRQLNSIPVNAQTTTQLYEILNFLRSEKISIVFLEVPTSLMASGAVSPLIFSAILITNILSANPDADPNAELIMKAVALTKSEGLVVVNADDPNSVWISKRSDSIKQKLYAAWCKVTQLQNLRLDRNGMQFDIQGDSFSTNLISRIQLTNLMIAMRLCLQYLKPNQIASALRQLPTIPGRLSVIADDAHYAIVDSVTEPVAFGHVVDAVCELIPSADDTVKQRRLVTVCGADQLDQVSVAALATAKSRIVILAPQNIGNNDLNQINNQLVANAEKAGGVLVDKFGSYEEFTMIDRAKLLQKIERVIENGDVPLLAFDEAAANMRSAAIDLGVSLTGKEDLLLITGVGAKSELHLGDVYYQWNEADAVRRVLMRK